MREIDRVELAIDELIGPWLRAEIIDPAYFGEAEQIIVASLCRAAFSRGLLFAASMTRAQLEAWLDSLVVDTERGGI